MKKKHFILSTAVLCPVTFILRLVQYFTVIDKNGYFLLGGPLKNILSWSVYGVIVLITLLAIATVFSKPKIPAEYDKTIGGKATGVLFIASAILTMITSGIFFSTASYEFTFPVKPEDLPNLLTIISAVLGILCSVHFAFIGISSITGDKWSIARTLGIFSPLFFAVYGIREFYTTFDSAGKSETKLFMLSVCAIAIFLMSLVISHVGSEIYYSRIVAISGILAVVTAVTGPAFAISMLIGKNEFDAVYFLQALLHTALMIVALCVLTRLYFVKPQQDDDEIEPIEFSPLNKYLNEIPDEDRGNDE